MKGTRRLSATAPTAIADPRWRIRAGGDFGGTADIDLVWRHQAPDGALAVTFLSGLIVTGVSPMVPPAVPDPVWDIVGPR
jgi:hypothetical protein